MKSIITTIPFLLLGTFLFSQNAWKPLDISSISLDEYFMTKLNSDGSFTFNASKGSYHFNEDGTFMNSTPTDPSTLSSSTILNSAWDQAIVFKEIENSSFMIIGNKITSKYNGTINAPIELEKLNNLNRKEKNLSSNGNYIISMTSDEVVYFQAFNSYSDEAHKGVVYDKTKRHSFVRIGRLNLKTNTNSTEFILIDQFAKNAAIPVGKYPELKIHFIGMKNNKAILGLSCYTAGLIYVKTGSVSEAIKAPDLITGYFEIISVDLNSFEQEVIHNQVIEKPVGAFTYALYHTNFGFELSWCKKVDKTTFESHSELIEIADDFSVQKSTISLPVSELPLQYAAPVYYQKVKDAKGKEWFAVNASLSSSSKRKDIKAGSRIVLMVDKEQNLEFRDNSMVGWNLYEDQIQDSEPFEGCLPCLMEISSSEYGFLSEVPEGEKAQSFSNSSIVDSNIKSFFTRNGSTIQYLQLFHVQKMNPVTGEIKVTKTYFRSGQLVVK